VVAAAALGLLPAVTGVFPGAHTALSKADDVTASQDTMRTGWDSSEPALTPAVLTGGTFGKRFSTAVNGQVYAQPLVVGSTVVVATENDWVYALNAATGAVTWSRSLGKPYPMTFCTDLVPNIGVTSTPVYNPANGNVYLVAQTAPTGTPTYRLIGLKLTSGAVTMNKVISGSPANNPSIKLSPKYAGQRPGLLLLDGTIYAGFASHCDHKPYAGFIASINLATKAEKLWTDESGVTYNQAGIWQGGGGLMSDGSGRIFFTSGNGISPPPGPGTSPPTQLAESTVRLAVQPDGSLAAQDFFSPANAPQLDAADTDFGSGGPVGLPFGTTTYPNVLEQSGKDGRVFLLDRDNLGGREQGAGGTDAVLGQSGPYAGIWGHPATFADTPTLTQVTAPTADDYVYYVGKYDFLRVLRAGDDPTTDAPTLTDVANSSFTFGYTSGSPVVTSNGTDPTSAVVWEVRTSGPTGAAGTLYAFSAVPPATCTGTAPCSLTPLWSAPIGTVSKFAIPATSNGMVYVGTRDGHVLGFGAAPAGPLRSPGTARFGRAAVGSGTTADVTVTARSAVTVTGVTAGSDASPAPFTVGAVTRTTAGAGGAGAAVRFPVTLHAGDRLHASVAFRPAAVGGTNGTLSFATTSARYPSLGVPLYGEATQAGLYPTNPDMHFMLVLNDGLFDSDVPVGTALSQVVDIVNGSPLPERVTSVSAPGGPFTAAGLPRPGTVIHPGQPVQVKVTFAPGRATSYTSSFTVRASGGATTVALSGTGLRPVSRFAAPASVSFGAVPVGHTATAWIGVSNAGNLTAVAQGVVAPGGPFRAQAKVLPGLSINGDNDLRIPVTFTPVRAGAFTGSYQLRWTDRFGMHTLRVLLTGAGTG
jgi:hypothetical protein